MPDHTCPHLSPVGGWCRLQTNFKCPAKPGRVDCPFPDVGSLEQRISERPEITVRSEARERPVQHMNQISQSEQIRIFQELSKPFPATEIQWKVQVVSRDKRRALVLAYLDARAVMDRLDAVVGPTGWSDSYEVYPADASTNGHTVQAKCRLTILSIAKEDVGEGSMPGDQSSSSVKAAVSDALKRAAVKFGIGRYLYKLDGVWVDYDDEKKRPLETPALPEWAMAPEEPPARVPVAETAARPALPAVRNGTSNPNVSRLPTPTGAGPTGDGVLADLIRQLRELPGGEGAIRKLVGRNDWSHRSPEEKRKLYSELRRAYRDITAGLEKSA